MCSTLQTQQMNLLEIKKKAEPIRLDIWCSKFVTRVYVQYTVLDENLKQRYNKSYQRGVFCWSNKRMNFLLEQLF